MSALPAHLEHTLNVPSLTRRLTSRMPSSLCWRSARQAPEHESPVMASKNSREQCRVSGRPCRSLCAASFIASPYTQKRGCSRPITPEMTSPAPMPMRARRSMPVFSRCAASTERMLQDVYEMCLYLTCAQTCIHAHMRGQHGENAETCVQR